MSQPFLPPELHKPIIDVFGDKSVIAFHSNRKADVDVLLALRSFSLVCKAWHAMTLRHTFAGVRISVFQADSKERYYRQARVRLLQLIKANPLISKCIQYFDINLMTPVSVGDVEELCRAVGPVETLSIRMTGLNQFDHQSRPSPLDGLHPLLVTPHLRNVVIRTKLLPTRFLEALLNIRSLKLTLEKMDGVVIDHKSDGGHIGAWRSSKLESLVVRRPFYMLSEIGAAADEDLFAFFDHIKHLEIGPFSTGDESINPQLHVILSRWVRLKTMAIRWCTVGKYNSTQWLDDDDADAKRF